MRLLPFSVIMLEPEMGTGLKVAQKDGAEEGNKWAERKPLCRQSWGCSVLYMFAGGRPRQWREAVCALASSLGGHVGARDRSRAGGGAKGWG